MRRNNRDPHFLHLCCPDVLNDLGLTLVVVRQHRLPSPEPDLGVTMIQEEVGALVNQLAELEPNIASSQTVSLSYLPSSTGTRSTTRHGSAFNLLFELFDSSLNLHCRVCFVKG
jgi:hypothetical protein